MVVVVMEERRVEWRVVVVSCRGAGTATSPPSPPLPELRRCKGGFKDSLPKLRGIVGGKRYKSLRRSLGRGWRYADTSMLCSGSGRAKMGLKLALRAHSAICEIGWRVEVVVGGGGGGGGAALPLREGGGGLLDVVVVVVRRWWWWRGVCEGGRRGR